MLKVHLPVSVFFFFLVNLHGDWRIIFKEKSENQFLCLTVSHAVKTYTEAAVDLQLFVFLLSGLQTSRSSAAFQPFTNPTTASVTHYFSRMLKHVLNPECQVDIIRCASDTITETHEIRLWQNLFQVQPIVSFAAGSRKWEVINSHATVHRIRFVYEVHKQLPKFFTCAHTIDIGYLVIWGCLTKEKSVRDCSLL
jgi:hypothetical protein